MEVAGVDGCPGGWLVARVDSVSPLKLLGLQVASDFGDVLRRTSDCTSVGIDVPIGLTDAGMRVPDREARKRLGRRASCVFPAVIRPALGIIDYRAACDASQRAQGKRMSKQAHSLGLRSYEVDLLMAGDRQRRVIEVHPEVCFWALNGGAAVATRKRSPAGEAERLALLSTVFGSELATIEVPAGAARDDLYDACAAAWTAARCARGEAHRLPADPPVDSRGLRMEIVY